MNEINQYEVMEKLRKILGCKNFEVMAGRLGTDSSVITNIKNRKYKISHRVFFECVNISRHISQKINDGCWFAGILLF